MCVIPLFSWKKYNLTDEESSDTDLENFSFCIYVSFIPRTQTQLLHSMYLGWEPVQTALLKKYGSCSDQTHFARILYQEICNLQGEVSGSYSLADPHAALTPLSFFFWDGEYRLQSVSFLFQSKNFDRIFTGRTKINKVPISHLKTQ